MKFACTLPLLIASLALLSSCSNTGPKANANQAALVESGQTLVQLGPRPYFLINDMDAGELKNTLQACESKPLAPSDFSIAHRGAPLQFPEHTRESYVAAARMGAGIVECDVAFTKDRELVCRHAQNDLHTTTNII
jgi:glycerophosphoryl diester phosphodiesterase